MNNANPLLIAAVLGIYIVAIASIYVYSFRKFRGFVNKEVISNEEYKRIKFLAYLYFALEFPGSVLLILQMIRGYSGDFLNVFYPIDNFLMKPLYFASNIIPVYVAAILFYRKYFNPYNSINSKTVTTEEAVQKIFHSESFYSAISPVYRSGTKMKIMGLIISLLCSKI